MLTLTNHQSFGVNLQNNTYTDCSLFLYFITLRMNNLKLLNKFQITQVPYTNYIKCINVHVTSFCSDADFVDSFFSIDMQNPILDIQKLFRISDNSWVKHIRIGASTRQEGTHRVSGHPLKGQEKKGRDLTQSYDKSPYINRNVKGQRDNTKTSPKNSIKLRLRTDLGRSVGVTIVPKLVWFTGFTGPTFPFTAIVV